MLSRFSLCGIQGAKKCVFKLQPALAKAASSATPANIPPEFPPPSSKRDHVNFPRLSYKETAPPVRLGFIPETWFQNFYPQTGYTGPYMFLISLGTYLYSKEIIVYEHNMAHCYAFIIVLITIKAKAGDKIGQMFNKIISDYEKDIDGGQELEKKVLKDRINFLEEKKGMKDAVVELTKAKTEIVHLQMEVSYRERMQQAFKAVKNKLDCQAELENVERRAAQKNVVAYVLRNVMKSITPDLEKNAMQTCISDLNALASRT